MKSTKVLVLPRLTEWVRWPMIVSTRKASQKLAYGELQYAITLEMNYELVKV